MMRARYICSLPGGRGGPWSRAGGRIVKLPIMWAIVPKDPLLFPMWRLPERGWIHGTVTALIIQRFSGWTTNMYCFTLEMIIPRDPRIRQIGRAHVGTPVTNAHLVCRTLLEKT